MKKKNKAESVANIQPICDIVSNSVCDTSSALFFSVSDCKSFDSVVETRLSKCKTKKQSCHISPTIVFPNSPPKRTSDQQQCLSNTNDLMLEGRKNSFLHAAPWAKHLTCLWQGQRVFMEAEKIFNRALSRRQPHCAVCALFRPLNLELEYILSDETPIMIPERSLPMIPEMVFAISKDNPTPFCDYNLLDEDGMSALLVCSSCSVCVHASCYGAGQVDEPKQWRCMRCATFSTHAECCLCVLRGGALKPTTDGNWAHLVCALAVPEVSFLDVRSRNPVDISHLTADRKKLVCTLCEPMSETLSQSSVCIQCSHGRCYQAFHTTCAYVAGIQFETSDWPYPIYCTCLKHQNKGKEKEMQRQLNDLIVGDKVIAKHKNGRYYHAKIGEVSRRKLYEVDFDDGSVSDDLLPEDVVSHNSIRDGPPPAGAHIQVCWTDGDLYGATFRGVNNLDDYTVEFEDGSELVLKRAELWTEDEELPKFIKSRLSLATERKYSLFYPDQDRGKDGPRQKKKIDYVAMLTSS